MFFSFFIIVFTCTQQASNSDDIRQEYNAYNIAFEKNDINAVISFYLEDAVRLSSNGSIITGLTTIQNKFEVFREQNDILLYEYSPAEIQLSGDLAVTYSTFKQHWTSKKTAETKKYSGRWLIVWARQSDGSWKISKEMWTSIMN